MLKKLLRTKIATSISILLIAAMTLSCVGFAAETSNPFSDLNEDAWYYDGVVQAKELGIVNGYDDGRFGAEDTITRAQVCQMLYNYFGDGAEYTPTFTDVSSDEWYANAVGWAEANDVISGYGNGLFGPNDNITLEQVSQVLFNNHVSLYGFSFGDPTIIRELHLTVSDWAIQAHSWALMYGIADWQNSGSETNVAATRGWVANAVAKYVTVFADLNS